jgi:serine/threonine protein kinase
MLWMAPEIIAGQVFNESVDVFSYAMCLLEVVDCHLPWSGVPAPSVPYCVVNGQRPEWQLGRAQPELAELIRRCWAAEAVARPAFTEIVGELSELYAQAAAGLELEPELEGSE